MGARPIGPTLSFLFRFIPKLYLSSFVGWLAYVKIPQPLRLKVIQIFANSYSINIAEAEKPLSEYNSIGDFFSRNLKSDAREIEGDFVSPVDGTLRAVGSIENGRLEQIKGKDYSAADFLGDKELASEFENGSYLNFYLSPKDYHHVHSPFEGEIISRNYIPGTLWPVTDWALSSVENLFVVNERVVVNMETKFGKAAVVFVGACNVGKIVLAFEPELNNRKASSRISSNKSYSSPIAVSPGERLGGFLLGSTIVVLLQNSLPPQNKAKIVKMGELISVSHDCPN